MTVALGLGWLTMQGDVSLPILFLFAALHGVARVFVNPAMAAIAPNIVPSKILPEAIALGSIAWQVGSVIGPAMGGFLYAADPSLPYFVSAGLLALAIVGLTPIRRIHAVQDEASRARHPFRQMVDGLKYVRQHRFLLGAITLDLFAVLLGGATAMLPVFARDILKVGSEGLGLLRAAPAIGASTLAIYYAWYPLKREVGIKMLGAVAGFGAMTILFGLSTSMVVSMVALVLLGAFDMLSVYVRSSLVQLHTPDGMRGRVSAVSGLAISASNELGELQSGLAAALLGPVGAVVFGGAAAIGVAGLWALWFPELRRAKTFDPPDHIVPPDDIAKELV